MTICQMLFVRLLLDKLSWHHTQCYDEEPKVKLPNTISALNCEASVWCSTPSLTHKH
jgi:hypothetical protein